LGRANGNRIRRNKAVGHIIQHWKIRLDWCKFQAIDDERIRRIVIEGMTMTLSRFLSRLISGDRAIGGANAPRSIVCWIFIAFVALFLTQPSGEPRSVYDRPLPLPPELGLE
jgi:hypothetical protein